MRGARLAESHRVAPPLVAFARPHVPSALYFRYNTALGPPYHLLLDTNFVNFAIKNKLEVGAGGGGG
jgi:hypothetical protein